MPCPNGRPQEAPLQMAVGIVGGCRYWTFRRLPWPAPACAQIPTPLRHGTAAKAFSLQRQGARACAGPIHEPVRKRQLTGCCR